MELGIEDVVVRRGWSASRAELLEWFPRRVLEEAVRNGRLERVARGRYTLAGAGLQARIAAERVGGVVSHLSAAMFWGLPVREAPPRPTITVARSRHLTVAQRADIQAYRSHLEASEVRSGVTTPARTVVDCAVRYSFPEALIVADGALRRKLVSPDELYELATVAAAPVRDRALRVALEADGRAQSPLESLVRGLSRQVSGLHLVPQVPVAGFHPDLYDEVLGVAVECDSFEHHARREDLLQDCERYNTLAIDEAVLLRFGWDHAMFRPDYVGRTLTAMTKVLQRRRGYGVLASG